MPHWNTEWTRRVGLNIFEIQYYLQTTYPEIIKKWKAGTLQLELKQAIEAHKHNDRLEKDLEAVERHMKPTQ